MRKVLFILIILALAFTTTIAAETPKSGGDLVLTLGSDPEHLNPALTTGYPVAAATANVYSALIWRDVNGVPQPDLAKSWEVSEDNLNYTFFLRENVYWHDGEAFTSADVKYTFEEILGPYHGRFEQGYRRIASIETPDDHTVVIQLTEPFAPFFTLLTVFDAPVLPKHIFYGTDPLDNEVTNNPVGTGPFKFAEWTRGDRIVIVRNENYFDKPAYLDRIIYRIIPDEPARSIALETGDVDYTWGFYLPLADIDRLLTLPNLESWVGVRIPALFFVFVNNNHPQLSDRRVRQALMHAIDRDLIVDFAYEGRAETNIGPMGSAFNIVYKEEVNYNNLYPYDPDRARELLAEAGVEDLEISIIFDSGRPAFRDTVEIIRDNLRDVGITLLLDPMERSVMIENVYVQRTYDLSMQSFTSGGDPAIGYHRIFETKEPGDLFVSATFYSNKEVDELFAIAGAVADLEARAAIYHQIVDILAVDVPLLSLFEEKSIELNHKNLRGLRQSLDVRDQLHRAWWAE